MADGSLAAGGVPADELSLVATRAFIHSMRYINSMQPMHEGAPIDPGLLRVFLAVLDERQVTRAAARVGLTQPALSHALGRLRRWLDDPLFVRGEGGMVPTARARALEAPARRLLAELAAFGASDGRFDPATLERTLVIATRDYSEAVLLPALVRRLAKTAPSVRIASRVLQGPAHDELAAGRVDLVIGIQEHVAAPLRRRALFRDRFVSLVRKGHPALRRPISAEVFAELRHVLIAPGGEPGGPVDVALAARGLRRVVAVRVATFVTGPILVAGSDLVITLPERMARLLADGLGLAVFETPVPLATFATYAGWHEAQQHDPLHRWLRDQVVAVAKEV
jgi:DNA-binding transcriptional LysR family regulator